MLDEVIKRLRKVPFKPFAILTSDGRRYDIPYHPGHIAISPAGTRVVVFNDDETTASLVFAGKSRN